MRNLIILCLLFLIASCEDRVHLEFDRVDRRLVVEGMITDRHEPYFVHLSYTTKYTYSPENAGGSERIASNATVMVKDDLDNSYSFFEVSPGVYRSDSTEFRGMVGRHYTLVVELSDGTSYHSEREGMPALVELESLYYETQAGDFKLYVDMTDPAEPGNFYHWKVFYNKRPIDGVNVAPDDYFNGNSLQRFEIDSDDYNNVRGVTARVEQFSITRKRYRFLNLLDQQINNGGTPFDAPASPIIGNVFNTNDKDDYALGYFAVCSVSSQSVVVQ